MILFGAKVVTLTGVRFFQCVAQDEAGALVQLRRQVEASGFGMAPILDLEKLGVTSSVPGDRTISRATLKERSKRKRKEKTQRPFASFDTLNSLGWN